MPWRGRGGETITLKLADLRTAAEVEATAAEHAAAIVAERQLEEAGLKRLARALLNNAGPPPRIWKFPFILTPTRREVLPAPWRRADR